MNRKELLESAPENLALTGRVKDWLVSPDSRLPVSCTTFSVEDSMEGTDGIEASWVFTSHGLRNAAGVAIDLSKLRPKDTDNGKGLVSSGATSFATLYSHLNETLRRGGIFASGAVTLFLDHDHPDLEDYISAPMSVFPWAKRAVYVDDTISSNPLLDKLADKVNQGIIWLAKKQYSSNGDRLYSNVCVTDDTWIDTTDGIKQVKDLIGKPFMTPVQGINYKSSSPVDCVTKEATKLEGFYLTGYKPVFSVVTAHGYEIKATANHKVMTDRGLVAVEDLDLTHKLVINQGQSFWSGGYGTYQEGFIAGKTIKTTSVKSLAALEKTSHDFHSGFLNGYFYDNRSMDYPSLQMIQRMLLRFGISSRINKISGKIIREDSLVTVSPVVSIMPLGFQEVYDCTISDVHLFGANGILVSNCMEVLLDHRATCLLSHVNLGAFSDLNSIATTFVDSMKWLCELHKETGLDHTKEYLDPSVDKQVGLGVIGLANLLAIHKTKYIDFVRDLEVIVKFGVELKGTVAQAIYNAYQEASLVAKDYGMDRAFTIAPTANCHRKYVDSQGFTTSAEISPPLDYMVDRDSQLHGVETYEFNPKTEVAYKVGWETQWRLLCIWQEMMDKTGLAHAISANIWNTIRVTPEWITDVFMPSPVKTTYYRLQVNQQALDKSQIIMSDTVTVACPLSPQEDESYCAACGG